MFWACAEHDRGVNVGAVQRAIDKAVTLRGTVMLTVRGSERQWCAVCAAVDGSIELRVGEPGSGWRHRGRRRGQAWLEDHGFVEIIDAWAKPTTYESRWVCAELLVEALREALGASEDAELTELLVHPGYIAGTRPPAPDAPAEEHIEHALISLSRNGDSHISIGGGRPESLWAGASVSDGELLLSPEPLDIAQEYEFAWVVPLDETAVRAAARRLSTTVFDEFGRDRDGPLFISCMPFRPNDSPIPQ